MTTNSAFLRYAMALAVVLIPLSSATCVRAFAQESSPTGGTLRVTSRLVELDVTVVDKEDRPVANLTQNDFTVYENGEPQRMRSFEGFSTHQLPANLTAGSIVNTRDLQQLAPEAPVTVLVLDEFNTDFSDAAFARLAIQKYLKSQPATLLQPTTFLAATDTGFQQIVDYTLDRERVLNGVTHLPAVLPGGLMRTGGTPEGRAIRFAQTLASLEQVAEATVGHRGRKNIIWVGRGFESIDLRNEPDHQVQLVKGAAERAINLLKESHATVYTIDPTLSTKIVSNDQELTQANPEAFTSEAHNPANPFDGTVSFNTLAPASGGRSFSMMNDVDAEIQTSVSDGSSYYAVSYVPVGPIDPDHPYRRIDVRVNRPGLRVITRRGYYSVTPPMPVRTAPQALKAEGFDLGNAVSSGITYTGLAVVAGISPKDPAVCIVQVSTRDIQWHSEADGGNSTHLTLVAVAMDAKGRPLAKNAKDLVAKLGPERHLSDIPYTTLQIAFPRDAKATSVRIAVRDGASGKIGTAEVPLVR